MPNTQFYTIEAAKRKATLIITSLVNSKLRLVQSPFVPGTFATKAELVAAEANFNNYTAGGYTLAAWSGPQNRIEGGAGVLSPLAIPTFITGEDPPVANVLTGWWVEDATGNVRVVGTLDPTVTMGADGDFYNWVKEIVEGLNVTL